MHTTADAEADAKADAATVPGVLANYGVLCQLVWWHMREGTNVLFAWRVPAPSR